MPSAPYQPHSETSREAAESIDKTIDTLREKVYKAIRGASMGLTAEELSDVTGIKGDTVRPRLVELYRAGRITTAGKRPTKSKRKASIWFCVPGKE